MLMVSHGQTVDGPGVQVTRELLRTLATRRLHVVVGGRLLLPRFSSTHGSLGFLQSSAILSCAQHAACAGCARV